VIPEKVRLFASSKGTTERTVIVHSNSVRKGSLYERDKLRWTIDLEQHGVLETVRLVAISENGEFVVVSGKRNLFILGAENSVPLGEFKVHEDLTIRSVSVSNTGIVAVGALQANLKGNNPGVGRVFVLARNGAQLFQENTQHNQSNAWVPIVAFDASGQFLMIQTREALYLRGLKAS
jgi:hypothetical protein